MTRDMRDPRILGEALLSFSSPEMSASETYDLRVSPLRIPNYTNNEGPIEKYGDPADVNPLFITVRVR